MDLPGVATTLASVFTAVAGAAFFTIIFSCGGGDIGALFAAACLAASALAAAVSFFAAVVSMMAVVWLVATETLLAAVMSELSF